MVQAFGIASLVQARSRAFVTHPESAYTMMTMLTLTYGTPSSCGWVSRSTERGIGNGMS
jgi:preprotein translocase subunit SecY